MVLIGEDVLDGIVCLGELGVTLAEGAIAGICAVAALDFALAVAVLVLDELANAGVTVGHAGALQAVLVGFAHGVESVNWSAVAGIGHWAIA